MKKRKIKTPKLSKVKEKFDKLRTDEESPLGKFKYKSSSLLDKTKQILGGYRTLDDSELLPDDLSVLQSDLKDIFSDIKKEEKKEKNELVWESLSAEKTIKRSRILQEKIINIKEYWISEFTSVFMRYFKTYSLTDMMRFLKSPLKLPVLKRLYEKIQPSKFEDNFIMLYY